MPYTQKQYQKALTLPVDAERRLIFSSSKAGQDDNRKIEFLDRVSRHADGRRDSIAQAAMIMKRLADLKIIGPDDDIELQGAAIQDVMGENVVFETNAAHRVPAQIVVKGKYLFQIPGPGNSNLSFAYFTRTANLCDKTDVVPKVVNSIDSVLDWTPMTESKKAAAKASGKMKVTRANNSDRGLDRFLSLLYKVTRADGKSLDAEYRAYMMREAELLNGLCMYATDNPESSATMRALTGFREPDLRSDYSKAQFSEMNERALKNEMNAQKIEILEIYTLSFQQQKRSLTESDYWKEIMKEKWL